ncbi:DUF983 domain-containing protein [Niastella populi]|uniref:DUF983 domain-containing protein n=1 Tax=Niastella populi TaxID=550983 RepID=A0A1V9ENX9_9BACT|nr:DUF983 domain-containing protein [Niastella populi]OQP47837.1 DUF983 domain-containing protein [Niastella populi]
MSTKDASKPNMVLSVLHNNCPRCRRGKLFTNSNPYKLNEMLKMNEQCPVCGQATNMEPGFYYGTSYVSYALAIAVSVATLVAWWVLIGFSLHDNRFFWWMGTNAIILIAIQPLLMRLSRTIWLSFFISYSPRWNEGDVVMPERTNDGLKNAW